MTYCIYNMLLYGSHTIIQGFSPLSTSCPVSIYRRARDFSLCFASIKYAFRGMAINLFVPVTSTSARETRGHGAILSRAVSKEQPHSNVGQEAENVHDFS